MAIADRHRYRVSRGCGSGAADEAGGVIDVESRRQAAGAVAQSVSVGIACADLQSARAHSGRLRTWIGDYRERIAAGCCS